jgi:hypothetical protein
MRAGEGGRGEGRQVREGFECARGGGEGGKKTFLSWFHSFIRYKGKKTENKSFFISF